MPESTTIRDQTSDLTPPWLAVGNAKALLHSVAIHCDTIWNMIETSAKASMPGVFGYPSSALPYLGHEIDIDRYEGESDSTYAARLAWGHDRHRGQGGALELINQTQTMIAGLTSSAVPVRTVNNAGRWWSRASMSAPFVQTISSPNNWVWDAFTTRWFRGWVIVDSSAGPWTVDMWGSPGTWGDGGTWGSDMTVAQSVAFVSLVRKWKAARDSVQILVAFSSGLFAVDDTSPPNPNSTSDTFVWQSAQNALFGPMIT